MISESIYCMYPPELNEEQVQFLLANLNDWSIAHGLAVRPPSTFVSASQDPAGVLASTAPVTLFPSLFPRECFDEAVALQRAYNELYASIAGDERWLESIVQEYDASKLVQVDDFMAKLWSIHVDVKSEGYVQDLTLGLFRSDYMVHLDHRPGSSARPQLKQVEFNTIASSFGGLSTQVSALHKHLHSIGAYPAETATIIKQDSLPQNQSALSLAAGLAAAHRAYGRSQSLRPLCVLFVVQDPERNVFDQRHIEYSLLAANGVHSFRISLSRILECTRLDAARNLIYNPPHAANTEYEVTTVYYRSGYSPGEFSSDEEWAARLHVERSRAVKCPSVLLQLAGCKKVQQVLATPQSPHLGRFLTDETTAARVLRTFAPMYAMDESVAGLEARRRATDVEMARRYVLKPQREGGGNNVYRRAIPDFLSHLPKSRWPAYILMEMIEPPAQRNVIIRNGETQKGGVVCELGIYGVCLWRSGADEKLEMLENREAGYLLRTKGEQSEEGGVAAGFGVVDSCCLA